MLTLDVFHHYTSVTFPSASPVLTRNIGNLISYSPKLPPQRLRRKGFHRPYKVSLFHQGRFPTGNLSLLLAYLYKLQIEFQFNDHRGKPTFVRPKLDDISIAYRDYQQDGIWSGLRDQRAIFSWPPGTGKTELLIGLVASIGLPTLWLTSSKNVLEQTVNRISSRLKKCPTIKVCLPETLWGHIKKYQKGPLEFLDKYKVLIVDECHHTGAKSWYEIAMHCNAGFRFAVSATPFDRPETNLHLKCAIGGEFHSISYQNCYAEKWLSRPTVRMLYYPAGEKIILPGIDIEWPELYKVGIAYNKSRNALALDEVAYYLDKGIHPLVMVRLVQDHAIPLFDLACDRFGSENVMLITGMQSVLERELALERLVGKEIKLLISTCILGEGQDVPRLTALINMVGGNSKIQTTQIAGRVMRPDTPAFVSDFVDAQHGVLFKHTGKRRSSYGSMGADIVDVMFRKVN